MGQVTRKCALRKSACQDKDFAQAAPVAAFGGEHDLFTASPRNSPWSREDGSVPYGTASGR
jgi:hypothetical protein